jgi:hypothetical protein
MHIGDRAIGMLEPKYLSLIRRLKKLDPATYTVPFFPYVGRDYDDAKHRILIIGKATYGWGKGDKGQGSGTLSEVLNMEDVLDREDRAYRHLAKLPKEFIENEIIPFYGGEKGHYYSQFWNRTYRLAGNFLCDRQVSDYKRDRQMSEKCFRAIAWSNVFKVGAPKVKRGNPNKELISVQKKENTLKEELEMLEPDVVVFSTGRGYDDHLRDFLPITSMSATAPNWT